MTQRVLGPGGSPRRRRLWHVFVVLALAGIASVLRVRGGGERNRILNVRVGGRKHGLKRWQGLGSTLPISRSRVDLPTGTDRQLVRPGSPEGRQHRADVTVVTGSIPNSKADLARFGVAGETVGSTRSSTSPGQPEPESARSTSTSRSTSGQPDLTTTGSKTLVPLDRRPADQLRLPGQLTPAITFRTWRHGRGAGAMPSTFHHLFRGRAREPSRASSIRVIRPLVSSARRQSTSSVSA